ncbi:hypothetical protein E4U26_005700 [Claviceps purpurea]|nr:hypothetical protein E4U26_005700 [Claviceps purpurea]
MERTSRGRSDRIDPMQYDIVKRFRQMSKSKQRRLLDRFKRDQPPTNRLHENISTFRKYGTLTWYRVGDEPPVDPNTATEEQVNDRILFYLNDYLVYETSRQILHRRFCEDFEEWTTATWLKAAKPLRSRLKAELEHRGLTLNEKCKENSDKLADIITRGYETSGETDWGSIMSDDPETAAQPQKHHPTTMLMQTPKCVYQHQPLYRHSNKDTPKRPIKRQHECMPQPRSKRILQYLPMIPKSYRRDITGTTLPPLHTSASTEAQNIDRKALSDSSHTMTITILGSHNNSNDNTAQVTDIRLTTETATTENHHSPIGTTPQAMKTRPIHEPWRQPHFYSVPHGYYPQHPYPYPHHPPPREYVHGPSPQEQQEQARRSNPPRFTQRQGIPKITPSPSSSAKQRQSSAADSGIPTPGN